jgi:hypothetical protein
VLAASPRKRDRSRKGSIPKERALENELESEAEMDGAVDAFLVRETLFRVCPRITNAGTDIDHTELEAE